MAGYNVLVAVISLTSARFLPETRGRDLDEPAAGQAVDDVQAGELVGT